MIWPRHSPQLNGALLLELLWEWNQFLWVFVYKLSCTQALCISWAAHKLCVQAELDTSFGQPALFELSLGDFIQPKTCEILNLGGNIFSDSLCTSWTGHRLWTARSLRVYQLLAWGNIIKHHKTFEQLNFLTWGNITKDWRHWTFCLQET